MKHTESINSRSWAREARRHCRIRKLGKQWKHPGYEFIHAWTHTIPNLGWIQARPCYVHSRYREETADGIRLHRRIELTGGWIIRVRPQESNITQYLLSRRNRYREFRVPGPVDLDKLARYMGAAERYLRQSRRVAAAREELHSFIETRDVPSTAEAYAQRVGLPFVYADMTAEHCAEWMKIARNWNLKAPAPRTQV